MSSRIVNENLTKILLVENGDESTKLIMEVFSGPGTSRYRLAHASDLKSALEALAQETFDLLLLNLMLPDSGGLYTLTKIRPQLGSTAVVVVNAPNDENLCISALNNGADDYISISEMRREILLRSVHRTIERSKWRANHEDIRSLKIGAVRQATQNMVDDLNPTVEEIHSKLGSLKEDMLQRGVLTERSRTLLNSAEDSAKHLKAAVVDLIQFARELSPHCPEGTQSTHRILVVEDEPQVSDVIVNRLKRLKENHIDVANNGQDAFNMCLESYKIGEPYSMVISDWKMPRMNGAELLGKLRRNPFYKRIPFMMISAVDDRTEIKEVAALKVSQYLLKPFTKEDFDKHFKRLLYHV